MTDPNLRVLLVWEPVMATDLDAPRTRDLALLSDRRAEQFWDRDHLIEKELKSMVDVKSLPVIGKRELIAGPVLWDCALVFPSGQRWQSGQLRPSFAGAPAVLAASKLNSAIESAHAAGPAL